MPSQVVGVAELLPAIRGIHSLPAGRLVVGPHDRGTTSRSGRALPLFADRIVTHFSCDWPLPPRKLQLDGRLLAGRRSIALTFLHEAGERRPGQLPGGRFALAGSASGARGRHGNGEAQYDPSHFPAVPSRAENRVDREYMTGGKLQGQVVSGCFRLFQVVNSPVFAQKVLRSGVGAFSPHRAVLMLCKREDRVPQPSNGARSASHILKNRTRQAPLIRA